MKILVVVDMQNDFLHGALRNEKGIEIIPAVVEKINEYKSENCLVIATRDTHGEDYLNTQEGEKLPVTHCVKYSWGWRINEDIEKALGESETYCEQTIGNWQKEDRPLAFPFTLIFDKYAFGSYELAYYLKNNYFKVQKKLEIELVGVCTDICVISNAMLIKAVLPEAKVKVNSALCAGVSESSHETALSAMKSCQIEII